MKKNINKPDIKRSKTNKMLEIFEKSLEDNNLKLQGVLFKKIV